MHRIAAVTFLTAIALLAQSVKTPAGHWKGTIQAPNGDLNIEVDLALDSGAWIGRFAIPPQGVKGLELSGLSIKEAGITFSVKGPGDPEFHGTLSKDGTKISGELSQGGGSVPFELTRTGDAVIEKPVVNAALSKELEGTWEGSLEAGGQQLRLRLVLANKAGAGQGTLISLDQGNIEIPVGKITQAESKIKLEVPTVGGGFEGELKGNELNGQWSQGGNTLPLKLSRPAK